MDRPKVVVVGYGFAGRCFHSYLVGLADGLELYGIVTSRPEAQQQIRQNLGVKTFATFAEALADNRVDLIVLATPNDLHAQYAVRAMEAGKHVVTDKPMCLTLEEADRMIAASRKHDRLLSVFQNRRWDGDFLTVRQILDQDLLGDLFQLELFWGQYGPPGGWRGQSAHGGGKFFDLGAHLIDQALQLVLSPVERVYARFHQDLLDSDIEDNAHCIISFANGVEAHIGTSSLARHSKPRWYAMGTQGTLVKEGIDPQERAMIAGDIDSAQEDPAHYPRLHLAAAGQPAEMTLQTIPGRWRSFYENIAARLRGDAELAVTPESVRAVMTVIRAAQQSAASGQAVELEGVSGA
ncbi:MAG: Gfo/Idh/MocA family oxidoreductase [Gemmatimonadetes bacterium]|mgnify:CR=1 FL=1|jgi:scyllo-inositol 2-dehydrogenase (NADP+)|nr:Gfo/Idh/MocA family oxidoreductase [Gemmatimonadota bacterium]